MWLMINSPEFAKNFGLINRTAENEKVPYKSIITRSSGIHDGNKLCLMEIIWTNEEQMVFYLMKCEDINIFVSI